MREPAGASGSITDVLQLVPAWLLQTVAAFPLRDEPAPALVYVVFGLAFLSFVVLALLRSEAWDRSLFLLLLIASTALPIVLTMLTMSSRGAIWQGRYGLAVFVGICVTAGSIIGRAPLGGWWSAPLLFVGSVGLAIAHTVSVANVLRNELHNTTSSSDPGWHQPGIMLVVVMAFLGASLMLFLASPIQRNPQAGSL